MDKNVNNIIESLIFVSGKPLRIKKIAQIMKLSEEKIEEEINNLSKYYLENERGVTLLIKEGRVQMVSNPIYAEQVKNLITEDMQEDLSKVALETIAIIAYRGPITRAEIELIRGVNCIYILRNLMIRGLIEKAKSEKDTRKSIYQVSFKFLRHLGLNSIEELPDFDDFSKEILAKKENQD